MYVHERESICVLSLKFHWEFWLQKKNKDQEDHLNPTCNLPNQKVSLLNYFEVTCDLVIWPEVYWSKCASHPSKNTSHLAERRKKLYKN